MTFVIDHPTAEVMRENAVRPRELSADEAVELLRADDGFFSWVGGGFASYADAFEQRFGVRIPVETTGRPMYWPPQQGTAVLQILTNLGRLEKLTFTTEEIADAQFRFAIYELQ
ncbi:MAG: hypothetical protein Q7S02_04220 [bacterium]|nr:hypothetical protein [bacterium]